MFGIWGHLTLQISSYCRKIDRQQERVVVFSKISISCFISNVYFKKSKQIYVIDSYFAVILTFCNFFYFSRKCLKLPKNFALFVNVWFMMNISNIKAGQPSWPIWTTAPCPIRSCS